MASGRKCNKKCRTHRARAAVAVRYAHQVKAGNPGLTFREALKKGWKFAKVGKKGSGDAHLKLIKAAKRAQRKKRRNARRLRNLKRQDRRELAYGDLKPLLSDI